MDKTQIVTEKFLLFILENMLDKISIFLSKKYNKEILTIEIDNCIKKQTEDIFGFGFDIGNIITTIRLSEKYKSIYIYRDNSDITVDISDFINFDSWFAKFKNIYQNKTINNIDKIVEDTLKCIDNGTLYREYKLKQLLK